jgi:uncharacterized membrane protein YraQ (UPF0718 family)
VLVIAVVAPGLVRFLGRRQPLAVLTADAQGAACEVANARPPCEESFLEVLGELVRDYARHLWMLAKPTLALMLMGSVVSASLLTFVPWSSLLADTSPLTMLLVAVVATFMPVPIALDVLFAALLLKQGVATGYVMLFAMTLGIYSVVPSVYLWREVSRTLAITLFAVFVLVGWLCGLAF